MRARSAGLSRHPEFLKLWVASAVDDIGSQVSALALPLIAALTLAATHAVALLDPDGGPTTLGSRLRRTAR